MEQYNVKNVTSMLWHTCPSVALCQYMILWSATYNIMEQYNGKIVASMLWHVSISCTLSIALEPLKCHCNQCTSDKCKTKSQKEKNTLRTNPIRIIHATYGWFFKIKIQFNSFEQSLQMWHKFLQIAAALGAICSKGPYGIYYMIGALQKRPNLFKPLTFSFSQT